MNISLKILFFWNQHVCLKRETLILIYFIINLKFLQIIRITQSV